MQAMANGIDHLVIAVADPDAAASELTEAVGLAFTGGGRHAGLGTFNRIAFLGDAYLELMGVDDPAAAERWEIGAAALRALERGGGFATWALAEPSLRAAVSRLQANGSRIGPVTHGSRERADGERVEWWTASPPKLGPDLPPLLIKHLDAGAEWGAGALAARRAFVHPIGSPVTLLELELAVADPLSLAAEFASQVGVGFDSVGSAAVVGVGRHVVRLVPADAGPWKAVATIGVGIAAARRRSATALGIGFRLVPVAV